MADAALRGTCDLLRITAWLGGTCVSSLCLRHTAILAVPPCGRPLIEGPLSNTPAALTVLAASCVLNLRLR